MDFDLVANTVLKEFEARQIRYAAIGGFALGFLGVTRSTIDMDFLLLLEDASSAEEVLARYNYKTIYKTENVGQFSNDDLRYGTIDFLYAFREISLNMLTRAISVKVSEDLSIKCLVPEDIIGLKLQALVNDPRREHRDIADMEELLTAKQYSRDPIDWQLLEEYFRLFDRGELLSRLKRGIDGQAE